MWVFIFAITIPFWMWTGLTAAVQPPWPESLGKDKEASSEARRPAGSENMFRQQKSEDAASQPVDNRKGGSRSSLQELRSNTGGGSLGYNPYFMNYYYYNSFRPYPTIRARVPITPFNDYWFGYYNPGWGAGRYVDGRRKTWKPWGDPRLHDPARYFTKIGGYFGRGDFAFYAYYDDFHFFHPGWKGGRNWRRRIRSAFAQQMRAKADEERQKDDHHEDSGEDHEGGGEDVNEGGGEDVNEGEEESSLAKMKAAVSSSGGNTWRRKYRTLLSEGDSTETKHTKGRMQFATEFKFGYQDPSIEKRKGR